MKRRPIVGVMGPGNPDSEHVLKTAFEIGRQIAKQNCILLTGGRNAGVMHEASRGAASENGIVIGVLPSADLTDISPFVTIPIRTGFGSARNIINILSSDVVIACGAGLGTTSEASLALKSGKPTGFICLEEQDFSFFRRLSSSAVYFGNDVDKLMIWTFNKLKNQNSLDF